MLSLIESVVKAKQRIASSNAINALWVEGSYATGKFNEHSDIDLWIDIQPGAQQQALNDFISAFQTVLEFRKIEGPTNYSSDPNLHKSKLYIEGFNDENRIELDMQESNREFIFDRKQHEIVILFDKTGVIRYGN